MLSELWVFGRIGFHHITDPAGLDHVLFVLVLAAIYSFKDWRNLLWVVTAFTVGHSVTLALAATGVLLLPANVIEFLIPITILATCVQNLLARADRSLIATRRNRALLAGFFGLIHGAGFANYLRSLFLDHIFTPLLGFNLGIEAGQIFVLVLALTLFAALDWLLGRPHFAKWPKPTRLRTRLVSVLVGVIAGVWSVQRAPW